MTSKLSPYLLINLAACVFIIVVAYNAFYMLYLFNKGGILAEIGPLLAIHIMSITAAFLLIKKRYLIIPIIVFGYGIYTATPEFLGDFTKENWHFVLLNIRYLLRFILFVASAWLAASSLHIYLKKEKK